MTETTAIRNANGRHEKLTAENHRAVDVLLWGLTMHHRGWRQPKMNSCNLEGTSGGSPVRRTRSAADQWLRIRAARFSISDTFISFGMLTICDLLTRPLESTSTSTAVCTAKLAVIRDDRLCSNLHAALSSRCFGPKAVMALAAIGDASTRFSRTARMAVASAAVPEI